MNGKWHGQAALLALGIIWAGSAGAWGRPGHETIGSIAAQELKRTNAERRLRQILGPQMSLAAAAVWADCAKGYSYCNAPLSPDMTDYKQRNPKHKSYHYTDVPFQSTAYRLDAIGAGSNDIVHALRDAILVLQGKATLDPAHDFSERDAVMVVAHLVGDLHQPLHVGSAYIANATFIYPATHEIEKVTGTVGGNLLCVRSSNLHSLWDTSYVRSAMRAVNAATSDAFAGALMAADGTPASQGGAPETWPGQWANESLALAKRAFANVTIEAARKAGPGGSCSPPSADMSDPENMWTVRLPIAYAHHAREDASRQITLAGKRLALLLRTVWP